jgi:cell division protein FtsB
MRKRLFDIIVFGLCLSLYGYFGWSYFYGSHSVAALERIDADVADLNGRLEAAIAARKALEARVVLLRPENIDPDMLDETARQVLDYAGTNDLIINIK